MRKWGGNLETKIIQYPRGNNKGGVLDTDICPTITASRFEQNTFIGGVYTKASETHQRGVLEGASRAIKAEQHDAGVAYEIEGEQVGVRKLTPIECWRLMGWDDEDFYKAKNALNEKFYKGNDKSNSQLYKQAGNGIVVDVLEDLIGQML